jgi:predicted metal-dependent hydrolase
LRQRDVLKELYGHIDQSMLRQQALCSRTVDAIKQYFDNCTDMFVSTLRATLEGYRDAKLAFLRQNFAVYENHRAMINRVHARCRNSLISLMTGQRDRFDECVLKKLHQYVRASATSGYNQFQRTTGTNIILLSNSACVV